MNQQTLAASMRSLRHLIEFNSSNTMLELQNFIYQLGGIADVNQLPPELLGLYLTVLIHSQPEAVY